MMIDAHVHVWQPGDGHRVLIRERVSALDEDFSFERLMPELPGAGVEQVVLVSAAQSWAETQRLLQVARRFPLNVAGVVGYLPMDEDDFEHRLEQACLHPALVGLRLPLVVFDDADWIRRPRVGRALDAIAARGLVAQVLAGPAHLAACAQVLAEHPRLAAVIDHAGNPGPRNRDDTVWLDGLAALGRDTAAWCKVGDFAPAVDLPADEDRCTTVLRHVLACFGNERLLYGSNWPVSALQQRYPAVAGGLRAAAGRVGLDVERLEDSMTRNALRLCARAAQPQPRDPTTWPV
jgi:L-fuconolactonase